MPYAPPTSPHIPVNSSGAADEHNDQIPEHGRASFKLESALARLQTTVEQQQRSIRALELRLGKLTKKSTMDEGEEQEETIAQLTKTVARWEVEIDFKNQYIKQLTNTVREQRAKIAELQKWKESRILNDNLQMEMQRQQYQEVVKNYTSSIGKKRPPSVALSRPSSSTAPTLVGQNQPAATTVAGIKAFTSANTSAARISQKQAQQMITTAGPSLSRIPRVSNASPALTNDTSSGSMTPRPAWRLQLPRPTLSHARILGNVDTSEEARRRDEETIAGLKDKLAEACAQLAAIRTGSAPLEEAQARRQAARPITKLAGDIAENSEGEDVLAVEISSGRVALGSGKQIRPYQNYSSSSSPT